MIKRILSLILTLGLVLALLPQTALAAPEATVITVRQAGTIASLNLVDGVRSLAVYVNGYDDLLISGEDLEESTGFTYENNGKTATFTRGTKTIEVDLSDGDMYPVLGGTELSRKECISEPMQVGDRWYFSAASLLPWLNVSCDVEDGDLVILPDDYSFWDIWGELDLADYELSYGDVATEFAWDSKVVKAMNFTQDNVGEKLTEALHYTDEYDGSVKDYFDILECLLLDSTHSEYLADTIHDTAEGGLNVADLFAGDFGPIIKAFQVVNDGIYYAAQYAAFTANHSDKMELINSIILNRAGDAYTAQLEDAAIMVENTYTSWWDGILNKFVLNLDKYLVDAIKDAAVSNPIGKAILLAVDVGTKEIQNLNTRISLMAPLYNLYSVGRSFYESSGTHYASIRDRRCHAILSLYAAGENFRTLVTYSEKHDRYDLASKYERLANECDAWIKELTAASLSQMNDSHCHWEPDGDDEGDKMDYSNQLLDLFEKLDFYTPASGGIELVEYAIVADFLEYQPLIGQTWDLYFSEGSATYSFVVDGILEQSGSTLTFQWELEAESRRSSLSAMGSMQDMDDPDLSEVTISGTASDILSQMDSYFSQRGGLIDSRSADLNGDGAEDRLFALSGAANMWLNRMELRSYSLGDQNPFGQDALITLVCAESASNGVRVRVMRLPLPDQPKWSLSGNVLTVDGTEYIYQSDGEDPFFSEAPAVPAVDPSGIALTELMLLSYDEVTALMTDYSDWTSSDGETIYGEGRFNGSYAEIRFELRDGAFRPSSLEVIFGDSPILVTPAMTSAVSVEEAEATLQPTLPWSLKDSDTEGDAVYYFHSGFYYDAPSDSAWYVYVRTKEVWDAEKDGWGPRTFAGIQLMYSESLNDPIPDWLLDAYS